MPALVVYGTCATSFAQPSGSSLVDALEREARVLRAEKAVLEKTLKDAKASAQVARDSLLGAIDSTTAQLVRLRSENSQRQRSLPERERIADRESQRRQLKELNARIAAWLSARGSSEDSMSAALELVLDHGSLNRRKAQPLFEEDGAQVLEPLLHVGRVAAFSAHGPVLPVEDGSFRQLTLRAEPRSGADGTIRSGYVFDPENPTGPSEVDGVQRWFSAGGVLLWPILILAAMAAAVVVERSTRLVILSFQWRSWRRALSACEARHDWECATREATELRPRWLAEPFVQILARRELPVHTLEERATESLLKLRPLLHKRLTVLGVTAAVAPLLGLLGTVTGMISTFSAITTHGTGDPRLLSDGISEALITTQLGLAVAVPALLLHTGFLRWAGALFAKIEDACVSLLHHLEDLELPRERVVHHDDESHHHHG